jgi:hypothetical protein
LFGPISLKPAMHWVLPVCAVETMKKKLRKNTAALPPFENGQVWQMADSSLRIGLVGKTLVHYKHYKPAAKRPPVLLSGKWVLEEFLQKNEAILLQDASTASPAAGIKPVPAANVSGKTKRKFDMTKNKPVGAH